VAARTAPIKEVMRDAAAADPAVRQLLEDAAGVTADTRLHDQIACHDQSGILAQIRAVPDP
jgi:hypothetical protein